MKWFRIGAWFQIITGLIHLAGHFVPPELDTDEKNELLRLMNEVMFQLDPWYSRSLMNLFDAFSLFLTIMLLTLGLVNLTISKHSSAEMIRRLSLINLGGMALMLSLSIVYAFSVPISLFGVLTALFAISFFRSK